MVFPSIGFGRLLTRNARNALFESKSRSQVYHTSSSNQPQLKIKTNDFSYGDFISIQKEDTIVEL